MQNQKTLTATSVNDIVPRPSASTQRKELHQVGFLLGSSAGHECSVCDRPCGRGWWQKVSYEYDEWECYCRECAFDLIHQYDDFEGWDIEEVN